MARTIWRHSLQTKALSDTVLRLPKDAKIVEAQFVTYLTDRDTGEPCFVWNIWVHIPDKDAELVERTFTTVGTGWAVEENDVYIKSAIGDDFVWHLFERQ